MLRTQRFDYLLFRIIMLSLLFPSNKAEVELILGVEVSASSFSPQSLLLVGFILSSLNIFFDTYLAGEIPSLGR